jgi:hypothetical protein
MCRLYQDLREFGGRGSWVKRTPTKKIKANVGILHLVMETEKNKQPH